MNTLPFLADEVISFSELCQLLKKAKSSMYALVAAGRAPRSFHIGRDLRFRRSAVLAWMVEQEEYEALNFGRRGAIK